MNPLKFIPLLLILALPVFAISAGGDLPPDATKALLTSGPWQITGGWNNIRTFAKDGTFTTADNDAEHGTWSIADGAVTLTFADGHTDTLTLPLDPKLTFGTNRSGKRTVAIRVPIGNSAPAHDADTASTKALLTSGPWRFAGNIWAHTRTFDKDGSFTTDGRDDEHGTWSINADTITLTFADGHIDTLHLPLNPKTTLGVDTLGGPMVAFTLNDTPVPAPDLAKLRHDYIDSLNILLQQAVKENKIADAKTVAAEIDKVTSQPATPSTPPGIPPCVTWLWPNKTLTLHPDGAASVDNVQETKRKPAHWHWTDRAHRKLQIDWKSGWIDNATLSEDGKSMAITNNNGDSYTVKYLPQAAATDADHGSMPYLNLQGE